jgi:hypothetical protein
MGGNVDEKNFEQLTKDISFVGSAIGYQHAVATSSHKWVDYHGKTIGSLIHKGEDVKGALDQLQQNSSLYPDAIIYLEQESVRHMLTQLKDPKFVIPEWLKPLVVKHKKILHEEILSNHKFNRDLLETATNPETQLGEILNDYKKSLCKALEKFERLAWDVLDKSTHIQAFPGDCIASFDAGHRRARVIGAAGSGSRLWERYYYDDDSQKEGDYMLRELPPSDAPRLVL